MKLINQSFEILEQQDFSIIGIKKFIERCARVSYKSEDKITDDSYKKFVNMLESKHHDRPLEFGTIHLKMDVHMWDNIVNILINKNMFNQVWIKVTITAKKVYITTNYRYYLEIKSIYPDIDRFFTEENSIHFPKRHTVHFITNRAIMDEFRTHIGLSHLAESTRYCNYSKGKFNGELTFIKPNWYIDGNYYDTISWSEKERPSAAFQIKMRDAEECYLFLLQKGCKPQEARDVLPLSIKSELVSCGFEDAWNNFFYRRRANDAHPMARDIAKSIQNKFKENELKTLHNV